MIFAFGQSEQERIEIDVLRYERAKSGDHYDDNWLTVEIRVQAGGFRGQADAAILATELTPFLPQLRALYETLRGSAEFSAIEDQLHLKLIGDGKGRVDLRGEVSDQSGIGNCLHFSLQLDQSQLATTIRELEQVIAKFPVR